MSKNTCVVCKKTFKRKESLQKHETSNKCGDKEFVCNYCPNRFTSRSAMNRHMRELCADKNKSTQDKLEKIEKENERLRKNAEETKKIMAKLLSDVKKLKEGKKSSVANINNETNINNCDTNINNGVIVNNNIKNVNLICYGKEDMTRFSQEAMIEVYNEGLYAAAKLTEMVHFNKDYPEYHNIYISNNKTGKVKIFKNNKWELAEKKEVVEKMYEDSKDFLEENLDEYAKIIKPSKFKAVNTWLSTEEANKANNLIEMIKNKIKLLLYNNRDIPMETMNKMKNIIKSLDVAKSKQNINEESTEILDLDDFGDYLNDESNIKSDTESDVGSYSEHDESDVEIN